MEKNTCILQSFSRRRSSPPLPHEPQRIERRKKRSLFNYRALHSNLSTFIIRIIITNEELFTTANKGKYKIYIIYFNTNKATNKQTNKQMKIHQSNNKWVSSPITVIFGRCMLNEESIVVDGWFRSGTHTCHHIQRNEIPIPHEGRRILHDPIVMRRFHLQVELLDTFDFAKADVFQQHRQEFFRKTHLYTYKHT